MKILLLSFLFFSVTSYSQAPAIDWEKSYGGSNVESPSQIEPTADGGYIIAGYTNSNDGDISNQTGSGDYWVIKIDAVGTLQWERNYGGTNTDDAKAIQQTIDGGYIVLGYTISTDGDVSNPLGLADYWVLKIDVQGNIEWEKSYGGASVDFATSMALTSDGGYILTGQGIESPIEFDSDIYIVKLNNSGIVEWEKYYGGSMADSARAIKQTIDNGYIIAGLSYSDDGDLTGNYGHQDYWVLKLSQNGDLEWQKNFGGGGTDIAEDVIQTFDGGFLVSGYSTSTTGDVTNNHGNSDGWLVKLDQSGNIEWEKSFGGSLGDTIKCIIQTSEGNYILGGSTASNDGDISENFGGWDIWTLKIDSLGNIIWETSLGGSSDDYIISMTLNSDGEIILAGTTASNDGDISENHGLSDIWIIKLNHENMEVEETSLSSILIFPNPFSNKININSNNEISEIKLFSLSGNLLKKYYNNPKELDFSGLSKGIYLIKIQTLDGSTFTKKIIKK